jgi:hypothetical protein
MIEFLRHFLFKDGLIVVCMDNVQAPKFYGDQLPPIPGDREVFFGPALRKNKGMLKTDVLGSKFLWVDADDPRKPLATLPPTLTVFSGHGWHLYWELNEPIEDIEMIERLNKVLIEDVPTADKACWNANRVLRVPGTLNLKDKPVSVLLKDSSTTTYPIDAVLLLEKLDKATKHKIRTGDSRGYRSRSERDWAVITALLRAGASDALIEHLFAHQPVGEKYREEGGEAYFEQTLTKAKASKVVANAAPQGKAFEETADGYLRYTSRGPKRVSTFIIKPKLLLDGHDFGAEDAIVTDVFASNFLWNDITFTRSAFTGVAKLDRETPIAAWQWLGRDDDVRSLLPYLMERLQEMGFPRVAATSVLGLHKLKDTYYFLGTKHVLSNDAVWNGYEGPLAWLPSHKEHPDLNLDPVCTPPMITMVGEYVPQLNEVGVIWPMLGWYAAAPLKTWFESQGYRFPILNVVGTKGSGKTTLIQRVFMPLFGQTDPKSYDAGTTRFVTLALLGSSNGVPIAFSEFRFDSVERFIRFILLSYDTGHDPRGRGDQTTVDYPLSAPFSVDGEDLVDDPAARERIVVAHLKPQCVEEGSDAYVAFNEFRHRIPSAFGGYFIQESLKFLANGECIKMLNHARESMFTAFPGKLPDRVRNNHIVTYMGVCLWCRIVGVQPPPANVMEESISSVFDVKTGRARTLVDYLVEDVVNAAAQGSQAFRWSPADGTFWFQLSSAHSWWMASRRRQGRSALERDAIKSQLLEAPYVVPPKVMNDTWMYGVDLAKAQTEGLDIPSVLRMHEFTFKF